MKKQKSFDTRKALAILNYLGFVMASLTFLVLFAISLEPAIGLAYLNNTLATTIEITLKISSSLAPGFIVLEFLASYIANAQFNFIGGGNYEIVLGVINIGFLTGYFWLAKNITRKNQTAKDIQLVLSGLSLLAIAGLYKNVFDLHPAFIILQFLVGVITGYWMLKKKG